MGYVVTILLVAVPTFLAVVAPRRTPLQARLSFLGGLVVNEMPLWPDTPGYRFGGYRDRRAGRSGLRGCGRGSGRRRGRSVCCRCSEARGRR